MNDLASLFLLVLAIAAIGFTIGYKVGCDVTYDHCKEEFKKPK
jgi:hypothetical protein